MQATMQLFVHFASSRKFHITPVSLTALVKIGMGLIKGLNRGSEHVKSNQIYSEYPQLLTCKQ